MVDIEKISELVKARKTIAGISAWQDNNQSGGKISILKLPVEIDKQIIPHLYLQANATKYTLSQHGTLVLVYCNIPIERMSFNPSHIHTNKLGKRVPKALRGLTLSSHLNRYYSWENNKKFGFVRVHVAEPLDVTLKTFEDAIKYFFKRVNIHGELPNPPLEPRLL